MKKILWAFAVFFGIIVILIGSQVRFGIPVSQLKKQYANDGSKFIQVMGMNVHYRDQGEGPVVVLVHGTSSSLHTWNVWTDSLKQDFRVIRMDLPGFGLTGPNPSGDYSMASYDHFLHAFLDSLGVGKISLAGNSLGGNIAWSYALEYPDQVEKLILIDASGYPRMSRLPFVFRLAKIPVLSKIITLVTPKFLVRKSLEEVYYDDSKITNSLVTRYYRLSLRKGNREALVQRLQQSAQDSSLYKRIPELKMPVLIMWGRQDQWLSLQKAYRFQDDIPQAQLVVFDKAGHVPMEEIPDRSVQVFEHFLRRLNDN